MLAVGTPVITPGGRAGFVAACRGAPDGEGEVHVLIPHWPVPSGGWYRPAELSPGPALRALAVGDAVRLYGQAGIVVADNGDGTYEVSCAQLRRSGVAFARHYPRVPAWHLAL